jgi:D-serine deaminase-like pyridoxal phosphate-dependent protein
MDPTDPNLPETPAALVDQPRMEANLLRTAAYCRAHGLAWRPHAKTHKTPELGAMQIRAGAVGLTVATLREGEVFVGVADDLLLAYPPVGEAKRRRLVALAARAGRLSVGLDSEEALAIVASAAADAGRTIGVLVELDVGMGRVGIAEPAVAIALAQRVERSPRLEFRGVMFYPGHVRRVDGDRDPALAALGLVVERHLDAFHAAGLEPAIVSGGSTPTLWHSHLVPGLTEVRPGTTIFNDRSTVLSGACGWDECAYSVLATVVSTAVAGQAVIDAGSKALSREEARPDGAGLGALLDRPEIVVRAVSEEHGILDLSYTDWSPRVGDVVRVVPNHVCVSVNLQERLYPVRDGRVADGWEVLGRGRAPFAAARSAAAISDAPGR